jgi:hypothetical protein
MSCLQWEERVALYAGGDLAPAEAQAVQHHVAECPGCQVLLSGLRESMAVVQDAHSIPVDGAHFAAVRARVMAEIEGRSAWRWRFAWLYAMAAAAVVALGILWPRPESRMAVPMPSAPAAPVVAKVKLPVVRHVRVAPRTVVAKVQLPTETAEPMVVKILTNDPDVVIYWITGTKGE